MSFQRGFRVLTRQIWVQILLLVSIMMIGRGVMFFAFADSNLIVGKENDVMRMVVTGLRYDLRIAAMGLALIYVIGMIMACRPSLWQVFRRAMPYYCGVIGFIVTAVTIGNIYYYQTYHNHYDLFVFGLIEDDTKAVLINMWQDYPILLCLLPPLVAGGLGFILAKDKTKPKREIKSWSTITMIAYSLIAITIFFTAARGSIGTFPLRRGNAQVSDVLVLNKLTPNGFMALDWANKDRRDDEGFEAVDYQQGLNLLGQALGEESLVTATPKNDFLAQNKPHVVLAIMESMGSNMLAFDQQPQNDLLGRFRSHFAEDFVFKRFVSADNGTAPSLAAMLFNSPVPSISHSSAQKTELQGSAFLPYKKAGYRTVFISPGNMMWRNLVNFLPVQGSDSVIDQNTLLKVFPDSVTKMTAWGLPDEYAFKYAEQLLNDSDEPLFIVILSVTNHPPYVTPDDYQPQTVSVSDDYKKRAGGGEIELDNILTTFQYSADSLGQFIGDMKSSVMKDKVLIAATGDHQMRRIDATFPQETVLDKAVPFYLHVPKAILAHVESNYDAGRVGSHKDILPTLMSYSLSSADYLNLGGRNILAKNDQSELAFGYNTKVWLTAEGAYSLEEPVQFYPWQDDSLYVENGLTSEVSPTISSKIAAFKALQEWQINYQVMGEK